MGEAESVFPPVLIYFCQNALPYSVLSGEGSPAQDGVPQ